MDLTTSSLPLLPTEAIPTAVCAIDTDGIYPDPEDNTFIDTIEPF